VKWENALGATATPSCSFRTISSALSFAPAFASFSLSLCLSFPNPRIGDVKLNFLDARLNVAVALLDEPTTSRSPVGESVPVSVVEYEFGLPSLPVVSEA